MKLSIYLEYSYLILVLKIFLWHKHILYGLRVEIIWVKICDFKVRVKVFKFWFAKSPDFDKTSCFSHSLVKIAKQTYSSLIDLKYFFNEWFI